MEIGEEEKTEEVAPGIAIPIEWPEDAPLEPVVQPEPEKVPV